MPRGLKEIPEITGMRGYASLGVVVFHFFVAYPALQQLGFTTVMLSWNSGVDFFFVLSGFLLSIPFFTGSAARQGLKAYYLKRILRIFPVYYLSLITVAAIPALTVKPPATREQVLASLFFLQSLDPSTFNSINAVNWTLVIEEAFYATLPIFVVFFSNGRWKYALPACVAVSLAYRLAAAQVFATSDLSFHLWQYPAFLGHYALGVTLGLLYAEGRFAAFARRVSSNLPLVATIGALILTQYIVASAYGTYNAVATLPGLVFAGEYGALIILTLTAPVASIARGIFSNRAALFAGRISYSTYVWHYPIEIALLRAGLPTAVWVAVSLLAVLSVASLSYLLLERPIQRLRSRLIHDSGGTSETPAVQPRPEESSGKGPGIGVIMEPDVTRPKGMA